MTDWQVKSLSKHSEHSGREFLKGERIISFLVRTEEGNLVRADILEEEKEVYQSPGVVLGWWGSWLNEEEDNFEGNSGETASVEEFFLSLYDDEDRELEEKAILKYLFAIMLERKRILKPVGREDPGNPQTYLMRKLGRKFIVPRVDVTAESVTRVEEQLKACL